MFPRKRKKLIKSIKALLILLGFVLIVVFADNTIKEVVSPMALKGAEIIINLEVNKAIEEMIESDEFSPLRFSSFSNESKTIETNAQAINKFKAASIVRIENALLKKANSSTTIQLGNIINSSFLSNRGPNITILYDLCCSVNSEIVSEFKSAGVNQTLHIMRLRVTTDAYVAVFWEQTNKTVITDYVISETVIVGSAPNFYGNINRS